MKITLARSAGFCFGVKRAIDIAFKTASSTPGVCMTGDIVHNEDVMKEIQDVGIKKINKLSPTIDETLLIRAHGTGLDLFNKASRLGYKIIDATCPMVKEIHNIAKDMENKGYKIIIIGDKNHDEVHGIVGQLKKKALVIDAQKALHLGDIGNIKKAAIVVQSTQNIEKVNRIVAPLKKYIKKVKFFNTICRPTRLKQDEIKKMPQENDIMLIIGSKTSANTKRLYEISKAINKRSFWVQSWKDIKPAWLRGAQSVGITAGASTPDRTISEIVQYLEKINL